MTALATTPTAAAFQIVPVNLIAPSPTNPRHRHSNQASNLRAWNLTELAESIRQHDVMQPITLRPNPLHTEGDGQPPFELVAGERRWRASQLAGKAEVPAMVREISDAMVLVLQITENIQGEPLHPLEEAEHFERMLAAEGGPKDAEELAAIVGKSKTLVRNRLELLKLCTRVREACLANTISASVALEIANGAPNEADQLKALGEAAAGWGGDPFTARSMRAHMKKHYMLRLDQARFDTAAKYRAGTGAGWFWGPEPTGACIECPKRTGANPDFFDDVKEGDLCQDAKCFSGKAEADRALLLDAARSEGATVISGDQAKKLMGSGSKPHGHQLLDQPCIAFSDHPKPLRAAVGNAITSADMVFIDLPGSDAPVIAVSDAVAQRALKSKGLLKITAAMPPAKKKTKTSDMALYEQAERAGAQVQATKAAADAARPPPGPDETDPLFEGLLNFPVMPASIKGWNDAQLKVWTHAAEQKATAIVTAQAVSKHLRSSMEEGFPSHGLSNVLLVTLLWGDAYVTNELAAELLGLDGNTLPKRNDHALWCEWAMQLDEETAARMTLLMLTMQEVGNYPVIGRFPGAVATALGLDAQTLAATAAQHVKERLQLDLVRHGTTAEKAAKKSGKTTKPALPKAAAKKATGEAEPIDVKDGTKLKPEVAWPFPKDKV